MVFKQIRTAQFIPRGTAYQYTARKRPERPSRRPRGEIPRRPEGAGGGKASAPAGGCPGGIPRRTSSSPSRAAGQGGEEGPRCVGAGEGSAPASGRPSGSAPPRAAARVPGAPRARRLGGGILRRRRRGRRRRLSGPRKVQRAREGGELQPRGSLPDTAPRPRPRRPALRGDEHPPHRGGPPRSDRPAPPGGAASARRDHRGGSRAGPDPPRILSANSRAHEHAGRLRLRGGGGRVRPDGGVPGHPRAPSPQGRDRADRRALSGRRRDLRPRLDVLLLLRQMLLLLVPRRQEREPRGVRPAVPTPLRSRGGTGSDLLHPRPVPSPASPGPRSPRDRRVEDRGADAGGGLRGRSRGGVPGGPRRDPGGEPGGGGGRGDADPLAGHRTGDDPRACRRRAPGPGGDGRRIGEHRGPGRDGGARGGRLGVRPGRGGAISRRPVARPVPGGWSGAGLLRDRPAGRGGRAPGQGAVSRIARRLAVPGRWHGPRGVHPACPQGDGGDAAGRGPLPGFRLSGDGDGQGDVRKRGEGVRVPHLRSPRGPFRHGPPRRGTPARGGVPGRSSPGRRPGRDPRGAGRVGRCADPLPPGGTAVRPGVLPRREADARGDPSDACGFREDGRRRGPPR